MMKLKEADDEQKKRICKPINLDDQQLDRDIQTLREWIQLQPHLPKDIENTTLGGFIIGSKNSLQRAKQLLDNYYTNRTAVPEFYDNRDPLSQKIQKSVEAVKFFPLPEMTPDGIRVDISALTNPDANEFSFKAFAKRVLNTGDVRLLTEMYAAGDYMVWDCKNFSLAHLTKVTPTLAQKFIHCGQDSMPTRLRGLIFINISPYAETLINIVKPFLKDKAGQRIHIFGNDYTHLYKFIPREILPEEYGGNAGKMDHLNRAWQKTIESHRDWFLEDYKRKTDESKRPINCKFKSNHLLGVEGSFRSLSID